MVVEARQSFQFLRQITCFSEMMELCLNLAFGFCITWLVLPNHSAEANFKLTTQATLNVQMQQLKLKNDTLWDKVNIYTLFFKVFLDNQLLLKGN